MRINLSHTRIVAFRKEIRGYYVQNSRLLPWRRGRTPYRILVSEIMLQQTQVSRVLYKYPAFIRRFPSFSVLSRAHKISVQKAWQGLGYNRRAVALINIARKIVHEHGGRLPRTEAELLTFPGVGKGTVGALRAFAFNLPAVFIETNIRRVFIYFFFYGKRNVSDREILPLIEQTLDKQCPREWYYALMDYGAMLGRQEKENPNVRSAHYKKQTPFKGSRRELRGKILKLLLEHPKTGEEKISKKFRIPIKKTKEIFSLLRKDGLVS